MPLWHIAWGGGSNTIAYAPDRDKLLAMLGREGCAPEDDPENVIRELAADVPFAIDIDFDHGKVNLTADNFQRTIRLAHTLMTCAEDDNDYANVLGVYAGT
jgi:hypothetical protein